MAAVITALRGALRFFVGHTTPDLAPEVQGLLAELHFSNRDVNRIYRIFQACREHDPISVGTLTHEVCTSSLLMLVQNDRQWIIKILSNLMELGGYVNIIPWDGFLWILLQFCTLSKIELCQVLFYIIAKETKSWSLHMLTNSQLEEFFEDWSDCPIKSFNTSSIGFDTLPNTRFTMVDFIELVTRYGALINPVLHLQRSIQQSLPSLRYWTDYDRIKMHNRCIPLDFFRFRKSQSISEMLHEADNKAMERELDIATATMGEQNLRALKEEEGILPKSTEHELAGVHLPLPGSKKAGGFFRRERPEPVPDWMKEQNLENKDPQRGTALGSAIPPTPREHRPQPEVAKLIVIMKSATGLPNPAHVYATCEIEGRPATRCRTQAKYGTDLEWHETHEIYGYIVDPTKRLEFNIWESALLVKLMLPQIKFYPQGFEGGLAYPGGELQVKVIVTLPKTVSDARDMVLSTFGEEARLAGKNAEVKALVTKLKLFNERKMAINRVQELDFIQRSRLGEPKRKNMVMILQKSRPEELVDRPIPVPVISRK